MIIDVVHTDDTENTDGGPLADDVGEHESSEFKQNLNGGPQADEGDGRVNGTGTLIHQPFKPSLKTRNLKPT